MLRGFYPTAKKNDPFDSFYMIQGKNSNGHYTQFSIVIFLNPV